MKPSPLTRYLTYQLYHARVQLYKCAPDSPEPLHQFRVSLRRNRSLLKLYLKNELSFPTPLKEAIRSTNMLRELDVLLLSIDPQVMGEAYRLLDERRREYYDTVMSDAFKEKTALLLGSFYDALIDADPSLKPDRLAKRVLEHYTKSLERHASLPADASQEALHDLRIRFKISRYGLEFLHESSLEDTRTQIAECKQIQNRLGDIQDLYNQTELLHRLYEEMPHPEFGALLETRTKMLEELTKPS